MAPPRNALLVLGGKVGIKVLIRAEQCVPEMGVLEDVAFDFADRGGLQQEETGPACVSSLVLAGGPD